MMKEKLISNYKGRLKMILQSHMTGCSIVQTINSYAVPVMRYSGGIIHWTKEN